MARCIDVVQIEIVEHRIVIGEGAMGVVYRFSSWFKKKEAENEEQVNSIYIIDLSNLPPKISLFIRPLLYQAK